MRSRLQPHAIEAATVCDRGCNRMCSRGLYLWWSHLLQVVGESLKGAMLIAQTLSSLGYACNPQPGAARTDIIQVIQAVRVCVGTLHVTVMQRHMQR